MNVIKADKSSKIYQIANYLKEHGEATSSEIAKGIGSRNIIIREVGNICSRHPELFSMKRINKGRNTYILNEGVVIV